jgi:hypothetical protein
MSTMTLRKRIALVAVTALGTGLLSVVAVPSANATGAIANVTGSTGLLASSSVATTTGTAVLLTTGTLSVEVTASSGNAQARLEVTGGVIQSASGGVIATDQLSVLEASGNTANNVTLTIRPTAAAGSTMTVKTFASETGSTVVSQIVVTIASSSVSGALSVANSTVAFTAADGDAATADVSGENTTTVGTPLFLNVQLKDAYKAPITSTTGALVVTVSAGARVSVSSDANGAPDTATFTQAVSSASPADLNIQVDEATVGTGWAGTITVSYNGVVVATKTGTITGAPASITLTAKKVGKTGSNAAALDYQVRDAANNIVVLTQTDLVFSSSSNTAVVTSAVGDAVNSATAVGTAAFTCTSTAGTADLVMQTTLSNATVVKSNSVAVRCGGAAATYTASFDKAAYAQGDIATLTVSFKDAKGNAANSYDAVSASPTADQVLTVNQTERVTAHAAAAKLNASGNLVYTFTVGTASGAVAGKYQALVSFPTVSTGTTQTVAYEVTGAAGAVSNADVLKAIVSLIASINKQIAALQKALLRR